MTVTWRTLARLRIIYLWGHTYDRKEVTALHKHQQETGHEFNFDEVKILCHEKRDFPRLVKEMIEKNTRERCVMLDQM